MLDLFARQGIEFWLGMLIVAVVFAALLVPYLWEEIRRGKVEVGPDVPTGAGDTHPGYLGNPMPGEPVTQAAGPYDPDAALSLRSFHLFLVLISIVLTAGVGVWGLLNHSIALGVTSLAGALLLVAYAGFFVWKAETVRLE
jgi:hypothetical protein